jgi:pathogenesis-related protein 1
MGRRALVGWFVSWVVSIAGCGDDGGSTATTSSAGGSDTVGATSSATNGSGTGGGSSATNEPTELAGITAAHNVARANVMPTAASPLPSLTWDPDLAAIAQAYAENCVFEHSMAPDLGENLYANTGSTSPEEVVAGWVSEVADYDYDANACAPDSQWGCGHYTQVVWADSLRLGCGVATCTENSPFGSSAAWQNWVCNYDPPGNWVGEKPY